ncbi:MAG: U32 family peptidase [Lachnospiraceae bacterium]|nr:U32 family peptidase [Lachnospiraceae bacterium]
MRNVELLSPAGSFEAMKAAANAGCDAVYIGGSRFGARAYANNLEQDDMLEAIDYMHIRGKKLYLTVNTLLKEEECGALYDYIDPYYRRGLDAVIVQDLGVLSFLHRNFPELPLHASTQMTLTMAEGANLLKDYGVTRLVPARELTLPEIIRMRRDTDLEIETFIHGALCYCYSGQCLMSSMLGGRSGNRGRCAQTCRMEYSAGRSASGYLLSPKDICTLAILPELMESGIDSFKIEGRMKRSEYTAGVTAVYRKYMDLYTGLGAKGYEAHIKAHADEFGEDMGMLMDLYNRGGFSGGYYKTAKGPGMMAMDRPNHSGVPVGNVLKMSGIRADMKLTVPVQVGDVLEIRGGAQEYSFTVGEGKSTPAGKLLSMNCSPKAKVRPGLKVYRTKNEALLSRLAEEYLEKEPKLPISGYFTAKVSEPIHLAVSRDADTAEVFGGVAQEAKSRPLTKEKIIEQLKKTGETPFVFESLTVDADDNLFLPIQSLNEIRREALTKLSETLAAAYERERPAPKKKEQKERELPEKSPSAVSGKSKGHHPVVTAIVSAPEQLSAVLSAGIRKVYIDAEGFGRDGVAAGVRTARLAGAQAYIRLPHIFRSETFDMWNRAKRAMIASDPSGFLVRSYEELSWLKNSPELNEYAREADYQLYAMNREAISVLQDYGCSKITIPVELNLAECRMLDLSCATIVVYGRIPLMTSAQCVYRNTCGCKKGEEVSICLTDRLGKKFPAVKQCEDCYNTILNSLPLSLLDAAEEIAVLGVPEVRLDFTIESGEETLRIAKAFRDVFETGKAPVNLFANGSYTRGHWKRGVE